MILVDTNILSDILHDQAGFAAQSAKALEVALVAEDVFINAVVLAELATRYPDSAKLWSRLGAMFVRFEPHVPRAAAFLAGQAHREYRKRGGERTTILPDFLIGAHALSCNAALLTRDPRGYASYFPTLKILTPETSYG
jgi:predicted nucleic acid-binding protein